MELCVLPGTQARLRVSRGKSLSNVSTVVLLRVKSTTIRRVITFEVVLAMGSNVMG